MAYPVLLKCVNDTEKVSDYANLIAKYAGDKKEMQYRFDYDHITVIDEMFTKTNAMFEMILTSLREQKSILDQEVLKFDDTLDELKLKCKENYLAKVNTHKTDPKFEMLAVDTASAIMKIGAHLVNIAEAISNERVWGKKKG